MAASVIEFSPSNSFISTQRATGAKRRKYLHLRVATEKEEIHHQPLLPGLPDHIAQLCLSRVSPSVLYSVCRSWRRLIYTASFPPFLSIYALFESTETLPQFSNSLRFCSFDPISCKWQNLPPSPPEFSFSFLLRHPSFISRDFSIQSIAVAGKLVLLAATDDQFQPALSGPILFDPLTRNWTRGPSISTPRRWCAMGASRASVFVASGFGSHYNSEVARSVEKWDLSIQHQRPQMERKPWHQWRWEKMADLKDGKFCREAIDAVGWRGKLCMVNVKGDAAKDGRIYDVGTDTWEDMPKGMLAGWRGPAAAMDEETIYAVDETRGSLKRYDHSKDSWVKLMEDDMLKGAQQVAAAKGKVCILRADGGGIVVVDVAAPPPSSLWFVDAPPGFHGVTMHILPRLSCS
ncbi:F-box family protein [Dorcoceras hygrometricum]|uniref:F-box family protein n=1 Tax=Dorcoceras hygrometricum TaxID=472368 RepID=A0A2Z7AEP6_9LAMI|nr:F-box family protein [Dorcoceras hygrometricum]